MEAEATTLWKAFREEGDEDARTRILEQNLALVHHLARQMQRKVGTGASLEDLVNAGCVGLLHAVETFDPARGHAFSTHAVPRVRGAMLDELRKMDHASRSVRKRQRLVAEAERKLSRTLGRRPAGSETAAEINVDVETLWKWKADARETNHVSLDRPLNDDEGPTTVVGDLIAGSTGVEVEERLTKEAELTVMEEEIAGLAERERIVLMLYYHEELKLREIAEVLGITESRVSQIRTKALATLRARMGRLREEG